LNVRQSAPKQTYLSHRPIQCQSDNMIQLIPMTEKEFRIYLKEETARYAEVNVEVGYWKKTEALKKSIEQHNQLLPQGLATLGHHLFTITIEDKKPVGTIWMAESHKSKIPAGFIYDLFINPTYRRKGVATQAMLCLEEKAKQLGLEVLYLHVFAFNNNAKHLYEKLGYRITSLNMAKHLSPSKHT
jgi:RimJ/RimL family protein N-acetyltransferase